MELAAFIILIASFLSYCRNLIRNGMWPTSVYNLGVGVAVCSASLIGDWKIIEPVNRRLWAVGRILHLPSGNELLYHFMIFMICISFEFL